MKYRSEIDGLRAIAVVPVIIFHAGFQLFSGGYLGVDVFFVISGYLITGLILEDMERGRFSIAHFYERRARRILPALFLVMSVSIPLAWIWFTPQHMLDFAESLVAVTLFSSNLLFWSESGYFDTAAELKPMLHTWSLAVEEQYYILFPLALLFIWRFWRGWILPLFVIGLVVSLIFAQWAVYAQPSMAFYLLPARAWELLTGAIAALIWRRQLQESIPGALHQPLAFIGLVIIIAPIFIYDDTTPFPGIYALVPVTGTFLVILFARPTTLTGKLLSSRVLVAIGLISYSAYLWHQALFAFARHIGGVNQRSIAYILLILTIIPIAYLSWRFVEQPFRKPDLISRKRLIITSGFFATLMLLVGITGIIRQGSMPFAEVEQILRQDDLKALQTSRQRLIGAGSCHFNTLWEFGKIQEFAENWECNAQDSAAVNLMIFGDSHAADKAMALRTNQTEIAQITGADCPLAPTGMHFANSYCSYLFDLEQAQARPDHVILAERFSESELNLKNLREILDYWSPRYSKVFIFTPMPDFSTPFAQFMHLGQVSTGPTFAKSNQFTTLLEQLEVPANVVILNTAKILCGQAMDDCPLTEGGQLLFTDGTHLSPLGARKFGAKLLALNVGDLLQLDEAN